MTAADSTGDSAPERAGRPERPIDARFWLLLLGCAGVGLGGLRLAAPARGDLLAAAGLGALFAGTVTLAGYELTRRRFLKAPLQGVQISLAVTTVKMLAFAAFLIVLALTTSLNVPALAAGLMGVTLLGEALAIEGFLRMQSAARPPRD
ncbi:MAG TPA: hypothetical protein VE404_06405 [Verrucomicrobiae bacterium]|nr:hypothetical protein [Verrucomicrobiae bacterium]